MKRIGMIAGAVALSMAASPVTAQAGPGWGDGYGACHGIWYGMMGGGWIVMMGMMLIWIFLIVLVVYGVINWIRKMRPPGPTWQSGPEEKLPSQKTALQILEEAYARGEIGREEFLQKRDDLTGKTSAP